MMSFANTGNYKFGRSPIMTATYFGRRTILVDHPFQIRPRNEMISENRSHLGFWRIPWRIPPQSECGQFEVVSSMPLANGRNRDTPDRSEDQRWVVSNNLKRTLFFLPVPILFRSIPMCCHLMFVPFDLKYTVIYDPVLSFS